jgi:hypothetical protein
MSAAYRNGESAGFRRGRLTFAASREKLTVVSRGKPRRNVIYGLLVALLASYLAVTVASGVASAATLTGHTIASAGTLSLLGKKTSGGGGPIDFWKVPLLGGDQVQILARTPNPGPGPYGSYRFELYPPGTTDNTFPQAPPVMGVGTPGSSTSAVIVLQAPYNGTFLLAVCQNVSGDCRSVISGGNNPMGPYTFTPTLINGGVNPTVGAKETRAATTIATAAVTPVGNFEAGGGNAIDFWEVRLNGGSTVQLSIQTPYPGSGPYASYHFELYKPGTTDTTFPQNPPVVAAATPGGSTQAILFLKAPTTGTFIFAVCQNVSGDCRNVDSGGGTYPMGAYTFTPTLVAAGIRS